MKPSGLLRWRDVFATLQRLVARGTFGSGQRLYQLPGGVWAIVGVRRLLVQANAPEVVGNEVRGVPVNAFFGGVPITNPIPVNLTLTPEQLAGPSLIYIRSTFQDTATPQSWTTPATVEVALFPVPPGGLLEIVVPLAIVKGGRVVTVEQYSIGAT